MKEFPNRLLLQPDQEKAIRGDAVPRLLDHRDSRAALVRGIRLHYDFAMSEPVTRLSSSMPLVARARNARRIMSNDIPERMAPQEHPYCIWFPDFATEETYRSLASKFPDMKYQVGRACAAAGYYDLFHELDLLPEVSIAEEARESEADGSKLIYQEIMGFKYRYAIMDDCERSIELQDYKCPAYLNGDTEVRWRLAARQGIENSDKQDLLPCIEEDMHICLEDQELDERYIILTDDEAKLLYSPLPDDLPTVKKTLLIQMAAHEGNIDRYARLANYGRTLSVLDNECVIRGILHHTMFARWWADQIKANTIYAKSAPDTWDIQRAIMARRMMINDITVFENGWPTGTPVPHMIWWPLKPQEEYLDKLIQDVPEMKTVMKKELAAAAIACDYYGIYKILDPEPSWQLWEIASKFSTNPFYKEDQERRGREKGVDVEDGRFEEYLQQELYLARQLTVIDYNEERLRDGVEKHYEFNNLGNWMPDTGLSEIRVWPGVGKISPE